MTTQLFILTEAYRGDKLLTLTRIGNHHVYMDWCKHERNFERISELRKFPNSQCKHDRDRVKIYESCNTHTNWNL